MEKEKEFFDIFGALYCKALDDIGSFLEDAMLVSCGHSFGGLTLRRVIETSGCCWKISCYNKIGCLNTS
ncbi:hypothetical protein TSUD_91380 [Trifolium subterraneum]|uniref:Uncharacterized protein n=1 Tax=Trifolium subterraneum TaxID=3900 RepID=A0A2Z6P158_TRISU|nr:hypothetical protein TSUD_91380 [Trifolium subterraneum]